jgi:hypothetical protein
MTEEIERIKERNRRVEADKSWEISKTRRVIIAVITYTVVAVFLIMINAPYPWLNALIPVAGFILSTLTLTFFKRRWIRYFYRN